MKAKGLTAAGKRRKPPKLVGVYMRPRAAHWAEVLEAVDTAQAALDEGPFAPERVRLPKPRAVPVYETEDGRRVTIESTAGGFVEQPFAVGAPLETAVTGGVGGGYLAVSDAPPAPLAGGASAADWASAYVSRVPEQSDLRSQQRRWGPATKCYTDAVAARTSAQRDEWGRQYFGKIREAAAGRDPVYRSAGAVAKGSRHFMNDPAWKAEEFHGGLFKDYGQAAAKVRRDTAPLRGPAPRNLFDHSLMSRALALGGALQKGGAGYGAALLPMLDPGVAGRVSEAFQEDVEHKLAALRGGGGGALGGFQKALQAVEAMGSGRPRAALAKLWRRETGGKDGRPAVLSPGVDGLKQALIKQMSGSGKDSRHVAAQLGTLTGGARGGIAGLSALLSGMLGVSGGGAQQLGALASQVAASGGGAKLLDKLPGKAVDLAFDHLLSDVDDGSSTVKQLLAKYRGQVKSLLKKLVSPGGVAELQKQWDGIWSGMPSSASVRLGLAKPVAGPDMVLVNKLPATRLGDVCEWPDVPDAGPFFQGNPTVLVNGMPAAGEIHAAKGAAGTIGTPLNLSPNVLMGEATVSVAVQVLMEAPSAANGDTQSEQSGSSGAANGAASEEPPLTKEARERVIGLQDELAALGEQRQQLYEMLNRGELSDEEYYAISDQIVAQERALQQSLDDELDKYNTDGLLDSDGLLIRDEVPRVMPLDEALAPQDGRHGKDGLPTDGQDSPTPREQQLDPDRARQLERLGKSLDAQGDMAEFLGNDELGDKLEAASDAALLEAARLRGGRDEVKRVAVQIATRRAVEAAVDSGLARLEKIPKVGWVVRWVKVPIKDGMGDIATEIVKNAQEGDLELNSTQSHHGHIDPADIPPGHLDDPHRPWELHPDARRPGSTTWDRYGRPTRH